MGSTKISAFHEALFSISRELTDGEVRGLKYLCKDYLTVSQKESITNALALFDILEQKMIISEDNFTFLIRGFENLQRNDLENMLLKIIPESEAAHAEARQEDSPKEASSKEGSPKEASNGPQNRPGNAASFSSGSESSTAGGPHSYDLKNSPLTFGDSSDNVYNYGSSTDGPASPLEANFALGSTPGSASASSTGGLTIIAKNSPITLGNSFGNQYNYGSKESPSTAPPRHQPQDRVPNANGSGDHDQVSSQSLSSAQQGHHPSSLNPATLRTSAEFYPHSPKGRSSEAAQQGDSGSVINPMSSGQEARMPVTSPQSELLSKMKAERARVNETPTIDGPNVMASQPSGPVLDDETSLVKAHNPEGNPQVESFSGEELNKEGETAEVRDNNCYENCIFVQDSTKTDIVARFTGELKKEIKKAEARADNHYQNCIFVQNSTHTNIAVMPAKCRRNSRENLLEEIKTMIRDKTLPEKVVQLLSSCDACITDAEEGCVKLLLGFRSVEGLKKFWGIYSSGEFQECLGRELSTGDIEISEEDFNRALRKLEDESDKKGDGQSPDQNLHQVCNPLPTCHPVHQKGTLKPPGLFTPSSPQVKPEGPQTLRSNNDRPTEGISPFHAAIYYIATNLEDGELITLRYFSKSVPKAQKENATALVIFEILESQEMITEKNFTFLLDFLTQIKREDLRKKFLEKMEPGRGNPPDQYSLGNPPGTVDPVLKPPGLFKPEGPKTLRSLSGGPSSAGQGRGIYSVDDSPFSTSGAGQSVQHRSFARASSLQNKPSGQSSHEAAHPKARASSVDEDMYAGSAQFSSQHRGTSGSPGSGFESAKKQNTGNVVQGSSVDRMMRNMSLQESDQSMKANKSPGFQDNDDIETDSPMQVGPRSPSSQSGTGQGRGSATPSRVTPGTGAQSRSNPREMSSSQQDLGSMAWSFLNQSPNRNQAVRESRQPVGISSSHQGQGSTSGPLLDLSTDSPSGTGRASEARNPQGTSSPHHQSASRPLLDRSDGINPQARQERRPPEMSPEEQVHRMNQLFNQQDARKDARAAQQKQPDLREYQKELAERPLDHWRFENHIICAPTGSGKTLTAAYICYQYWNRFKTHVNPDKHFKALFIVNMRHLTVQQRDAFRWYFPNKQDVQTIGEQQSFEDALKLDDAKPAVLMLTAQILVNAMTKPKTIDIKDLDMLIFDECHHTDLKHPYNEIMKTYLKQKQRLPRPQRVGVSGPRLPFIIGLSASLGVGSEALGHLLTLCGNMDCKGVVRVLRNLEELEEHVNSPDQDTIEIVSTRAPNDKQFANLLEALMTEIEDQLPDIEEHPLPPRGCQFYEAEVMRRLTDAQKLGIRTAIIVYMYLYEYNRAMMLYDDLRVTDGLDQLMKFHDRRLVTAHDSGPVEKHCHKLFDLNFAEMKRLGRAEDEHSNEKLGKLASLLHGIFTDKPDSKGIVLVRMKVATTAVADFIKKSTLLKALPCRVIPQRFVGQGDIEDGCLTEAQQKTALERFKREDGCNVLVATDIAQEGLDMPACNFVIRYNFVSNEIGTVQSKGRARAEGSQCFLIVESGSLNEKREYDNRNKVKKMIEAMEELEAMTEDQRLDRIQERQNEILEKIRLAEEEAELHQSMTNLNRITIHCKECSALVCKASELRRKGDAGHVSCISPEFKRWVKEVKYSRPQRFRDSETVGLIKCGTYDCGNQFGTMQNFLNLHPPEGYALKAQSFKIHHELGGVKTPKMWKKAGFKIIQD